MVGPVHDDSGDKVPPFEDRPLERNVDELDSFVGRRAELAALTENFRRGERIGMISGARGSGKTALAYLFSGSEGSRLFPDGVSRLSSFWLRHELEGNKPRLQKGIGSSPRALVLVDDIDLLSEAATRTLVKNLRSRRSGVLLVGEQSRTDLVDFVVELGPLSTQELEDLMVSRLGYRSPEVVEAIRRGFGGSPLTARMALRWLSEHGTSSMSDLLGLLKPFQRAGLIGVDGNPLGTDQRNVVISAVQEINEELIRRLAADPKNVFGLSSRQFEFVWRRS